jgi:hypothetical protein
MSAFLRTTRAIASAAIVFAAMATMNATSSFAQGVSRRVVYRPRVTVYRPRVIGVGVRRGFFAPPFYPYRYYYGPSYGGRIIGDLAVGVVAGAVVGSIIANRQGQVVSSPPPYVCNPYTGVCQPNR